MSWNETARRFTSILMKTYWKRSKEVKYVLTAIWVIKYYCLYTHTMNSLKPWLLKYFALSSEFNEFKGIFIFLKFFLIFKFVFFMLLPVIQYKIKIIILVFWLSWFCFCFYSSFIYYIATAASRCTVKTISIKYFWIIFVILIALAFQLKPKKNQMILKTAAMGSFLNQWLKMSSSSD